MVLIALAGAALYVPFLSNPTVFDDQALYSVGLARFAVTPIDLTPRTLPYFTIAAIDVFSGQAIEANRLFSLLLHVASAVVLFAVLRALLVRTPERSREGLPFGHRATLIAAVLAAVFALHPVAAYGAAYLAQRTIVLATLFSLLSILLLERGIALERYPLVIWAAVAFSMAVMCKEHSIMVPAAASVIVGLHANRLSVKWRWFALYLLLCAPAAALAVTQRVNLLGSAYEPDLDNVLAGVAIEALGQPMGPWLVSAVIQMGLFWDYLLVWVLPVHRWLSIDMRIDFAARWGSPWKIVGTTLFFALPVSAFLVAIRSRSRRAKLCAAGLLGYWMVFLTELTSVRFQEPFVLYRSYLWAPFLMIAIAPWLIVLRWMAVGVSAVLTLGILVPSSVNRLQSFSSSERLWDDAAAKLPRPDVPGAVRVYFNRGLNRVRANQLEGAREDFEHIVELAPNDFRTLLGRGLVRSRMGNPEGALADLDRAATLSSDVADIHQQRGQVLEKLGRMDEAEAAYQRASQMGHLVAKVRLQQLVEARAAAR